MTFSQRLDTRFYDTVQQTVRAALAEAGLDAILTDDPEDVAYLTGFFHHPGERPVAVLLHDSGATLLLPALEVEHALAQDTRAELVDYPEFPGVRPPFAALASAAPRGLSRIGVPASISLARHRQVGAAFAGAELVETDLITRARYVKHPEELVLHQEAARITDLMLERGVALVREATTSGGELPTEAELAAYVGQVGADTMYAEHTGVVMTGLGFLAGGLVYSGANSAKPHSLPSAHRLAPGETFMLSLGCAVGGRFVEGERTFILGEPSPEQERYYEAVRAAQQTGIDTIRPGITCAEANRLCLDVLREAGVGEHIRHRQGHGIGVGMHESPWLEDGDQTVLQQGFVVSNEPGIYVTGHAGYRVSDSMFVTADGARPLTSYPRSLDDIVLAL
ncbi:M24 family metallopeptidase [Ornithinimicrobium faecis]|uniref:M24 family metallopeptidase n=1 Tax=Ornithinimicrobium faecis TaxID=2934158 RepID=UPI002118A856|nr:Xaa-Pro peptidase family protein [Ornithinimicrobium sp. HY1745]